MKAKQIIICISICLLFAGCNNRKDETQSAIQEKSVDHLQRDNDGRYQLYCSNFRQLNYTNKLYAWYLYNAGISVQSIVFEQALLTSENTLNKISDKPSKNLLQSLRRVITELEKAAGYAPASSASSLIDLIRSLDDVSRGVAVKPSKTFCGAGDSPIDFIFGFEELASDSLSRRIAVTGMVLIEDPAADSLITAYTELNPKTFQLLYTNGKDGLLPIGRKIPSNDRNTTVSESFYIFSNVLSTYERTEKQTLLNEFFKEVTQNTIPKHAFNLPELKLIRNRMAGITEVRIVYRKISGQ